MGQSRPPRTIFGRVLASWLAVGAAFLLLSATIEGLLPERVFGAIFGALAAAPLALLAAGLGLWIRRRATWRAPAGVLAAVAVVAAAALPLSYASVRLNFWIHKPIYDSVVRDAKAGRPIGALQQDGSRRGVRHGVQYDIRPVRPVVVYFQWKTGAMTVRMVEYHEHPTVCPPKPPPDAVGAEPATLCVEWPSLGDGYVFWEGIV
ncbi:hypothetical protein [Phenylobacterium sp.]|uniref:hypothetical protein n=1 Tax=Phenylobacterium sp. TaxID=1871053 RepID=UPI0025FBDEBC|nr:hypothetical protein [Phenylobacterium sp.]